MPPEPTLPDDLVPMFARPGRLPPIEDKWAFEVKWDGVRALVRREAGELRLSSRNRKDITPRYPELWPLADRLPDGTTLDGEVVALDAEGRPSFELLQSRMHLTRADEVTRRSKTSPVTLQIFDVLYLGGEPTLGLPYSQRRELLGALDLNEKTWRTPKSRVGGGTELLAATADLGLEGIVAKRLSSLYRPGARSADWLKIKNTLRQEFVIGGWLPQKERDSTLGALLVGYNLKGVRPPLETVGLVFAGKVGTGFSATLAAGLVERLGALSRTDSPFAGRQPQRGSRFVDPVLVAEIEFTQMTRERMLRHPSFKGLRDDKAAEEVVLESGDMPTA